MLALDPKATVQSFPKTVWPHLNANTVMNRVDALKKNPNLIDQAGFGLCGEAAFFHHVLQNNAIIFVSAAKLLLMDGWGFIKDLPIHPDSDLLDADYGAIAAANPSKQMPPQADWMMMSALCDTSNYLLDFQGEPQEEIAGMTFPAILRGWYETCGLYNVIKVDLSTATIATVMTNVVKTKNNHITLFIRTMMIDSSASMIGLHYITLETPFIFNSSSQTVSFEYWTWGRLLPTPIVLTWNDFHSNYMAAIIAEF